MLTCAAFGKDMPHPSQASGIPRRSPSATPAGRHAEAVRAALARHGIEVPATPVSTDFGSGSAALDWAASGAMASTGPHEGEPRFAPGAVASAAIGVGTVLEALSPSLAATAIDWSGLLGERAAAWGHERRGRVTAGGAGRLFRARDGWIAIQLPRPDDWRSVPAWLETPLPAALHESERGWTVIEAALRDREVEPLVERARMLGLACAPAPREPIDGVPLFRIDGDREARPRAADRPLRVLDLSSLWAGPLATSLLAKAGASVLKVESPSRPDGARGGPRDFFDLLNGEKRGAALDLTVPGDRATFEALLEEADLVVESARPRALRQLGFDAEAWVADRAGRLWLSITGYGRDHEWIAFGDDAAIAAGLAWAPDADDGDPCFCGDALADPLAGLHAAAIAVAFAQAGRGGLIDLSLRDALACSAATPMDLAAVEVFRTQEGFGVRDADTTTPVAAPRLRSPWLAAPTLSAPTSDTLDAWRRGRC